MPLPKFEDFKAPWELKDGNPVPEEEQEVDTDKLKKYIYGLLGDKEKAQQARDTAATQATELQTKVAELEKSVQSDDPNAATTVLQNQLKDLQKQFETATKANLVLTVAASKKLDDELVEFLKGDTKEELEASADKLLAALGTAPAGGEEDPGNTGTLQTTPRKAGTVRVINPGDPSNTDGGSDLPTEDYVKQYESRSIKL